MYRSGTRTVEAYVVQKIMITLLKKKTIEIDDNFSKCLSKSYDEVLALKHGWLVRKAAAVGFGLAPFKKSTAYKVMFGIIIVNI
jgi:hypothetical protein